MRTLIFSMLLMTAVLLGNSPAAAQDFTAADFVGTWEGQYSYEWFGGGQSAMTLEVESGGFYTDSSGYLMPPYYYPDTQNWEYDAATNRLHFWYLDTVYAGQNFYQHFYYEVVSYTGSTLELHYNFWDDPQPQPDAGTIVLQRAGGVAPAGDLLGRTVLRGNYPNPFNPATTIEFSLARDQFVTLKVFDVRGREVITLVSRDLAAGEHRYDWNAAGLADGVYLYRLTAGDHAETRKMTLVK